MKEFEKITLDVKLAQAQLHEFHELLNDNAELGESRLLKHFKERTQLCALLGCFHPKIAMANVVAHEYDVFGDYACDFIAGETDICSFCFVEFEEAKKQSVFSDTKRSNRKWSSTLEEGFGQIIDWMYKLDDIRRTDDFCNRFGTQPIDAACVLVVGRSSFVSEKEHLRLAWRARHVLVNGQHIRCLTYDQLCDEMDRYLSLSTAIAPDH